MRRFSDPSHSGAADRPEDERPEPLLLRLLAVTESGLLYVVSVVLLVVGVGVLGQAVLDAVVTDVAWTERFLRVLEELLLVLIVIEIFITVQAHLHGGRLQLEPFIIVGVIAVVRHILSIVVRLSIPETTTETRDRLLELGVDAVAAFVLVLALVLVRWSARPRS